MTGKISRRHLELSDQWAEFAFVKSDQHDFSLREKSDDSDAGEDTFGLREEAVPQDVIQIVFSFLHFRDVLGISMTSSAWSSQCDKTVEAVSRYPYQPIDNGSGIGLLLDLSRFDWKQAVLSREHHAIAIDTLTDVEERMRVVFTNMSLYNQDYNMMEEGMRWIVQLHEQAEGEPTCEVPGYCISKLVAFAMAFADDSAIQQLAVKVIGILALQECNRKRFGVYRAVNVVTSALKRYLHNSAIVSNCCWALVIVARPLGALEGSTFHHTRMRNTANIDEIVTQNGIELVMDGIDHHNADPSCLAKAFWSLVNLSLHDPHKDRIIQKDGINKILTAMRNFPENLELQYRAAFALINLTIKAEVKNIIREVGGVQLIIASMNRFPDHNLLQRCACVVLRSLAWNSDVNGRLIRELEGEAAIRTMMETFSNDPGMVRLATTALNCIGMAP